MRVGVYVDGYNLYYGGRKLCGRSTAGWRWLNVRQLAESLVAAQVGWQGASVEKVVYCTARVDGTTSPSAFADQDVYLKALVASSAVDHIEYGNYVARVKNSVLATKGEDGKPVIATPSWPVMIQSANREPIPDAHFMVSYLHTEEKGSDVNVAAHLLKDVLEEDVDAAVVVTNDSDLRLPVKIARGRVPVGLVNPAGGRHAGDLRGTKEEGVGNHWFRRLNAVDFLDNQLADAATGYVRPTGW